MPNQHPIIPPPELVKAWVNKAVIIGAPPGFCPDSQIIATEAAQWGADQELKACVRWASGWCSSDKADRLLAIRRPKPPNLKQRALSALIDGIARGGNDPNDIDTIRRALESIPDSE